MKHFITSIIFCSSVAFFSGCTQQQKNQETITGKNDTATSAVDPLPSWNDNPSKKSIIDFVTSTTTEGNANFVAVSDRIACFDNDGTLWCEQPLYFQFFFAMDRIKAMAPQ